MTKETTSRIESGAALGWGTRLVRSAPWLAVPALAAGLLGWSLVWVLEQMFPSVLGPTYLI